MKMSLKLVSPLATPQQPNCEFGTLRMWTQRAEQRREQQKQFVQIRFSKIEKTLIPNGGEVCLRTLVDV